MADFVMDVAIVGMKFFQLAGEDVNIFVGEFRFSQAPHDIQNVQRPARVWVG